MQSNGTHHVTGDLYGSIGDTVQFPVTAVSSPRWPRCSEPQALGALVTVHA